MHKCLKLLLDPANAPTNQLCHERVVFHLVDDPFLHGAADSYMGLAIHSYSDVHVFHQGELPKLNLQVNRGTDFEDCILSNPPTDKSSMSREWFRIPTRGPQTMPC